jgi:hypothetical protein
LLRFLPTGAYNVSNLRTNAQRYITTTILWAFVGQFYDFEVKAEHVTSHDKSGEYSDPPT